jgi:hypothetical protein
MKLFKSALILVLTIVALSAATPAMADEMSQEQELEQECKLKCESGAYGQETTCTNECYQKGSQKQTITLSDGTVITAHNPVNTGLDVKSTMAVTGILGSGILATIARKKISI